jgi:hypothetical protein
MPSLGILVSNKNAFVSSGGLDFSALTALPEIAYDTFTIAAKTAATAANAELSASLTAQDVIDALTVGRGLCFPTYGGCLDASGGSVVSTSAAAGVLRTVTGVEIATQGNASLQAPLTVNGLQFSNHQYSLGNLSGWTAGESFCVVDAGTARFNAFWTVGTSGLKNMFPGDLANDGEDEILDDFGADRRRRGPALGLRNQGIYNPRIFASGELVYDWNGASAIFAPSVTISFNSAAELGRSDGGNWDGLLLAFALNDAPYTTNQRVMIKHFLASLFNITVPFF